MENKENKATGGEISGFDDVTDNQKEQVGSGFTITPDGGFFTTQQEPEQEQQPQEPNPFLIQPEPEQPTSPDFFPSGTYGQQPLPDVDDVFNSKPPKNPKKPREKRHYGSGMVILCILLAAVIGAGAGGAAVFFGQQYLTDKDTEGLALSDTNKTITNIKVDEETDSAIQAASEKATPSVVGIRTTFAVNNFFGGSGESTGEGSGVIYSSDGYIITNYHVIESVMGSAASTIKVFINSNSKDGIDATVVGYNISNDLAVLKINKTGLTAIEVAKSDNLKTGQYVAVIGCPGGLDYMGSVTYGIISGLNRSITTEDSDQSVALIQTDAAINPGNSGGAMVNTSGQLVGVPSSKIVSASYEGMGFAIPSDTVVKICNQIIAKENSPEPYIGITISQRYESSTLNMLGYPSGAVVQSIADGSPADSAGIQRGDIITEFNGTAITGYANLTAVINECSPGETVTVKFFRSGRYYSTSLTIGSNS